MRRILASVTALAVVLTLASCAPSDADGGVFQMYGYDGGAQSEYVIENQYLKLTFYPETTWFEVEDKITGELWTSTPATIAGKEEPGVNGSNGDNGDNGADGDNGGGFNGSNGGNGMNGANGQTGENGVNGDNGINGQNGDNGIVAGATDEQDPGDTTEEVPASDDDRVQTSAINQRIMQSLVALRYSDKNGVTTILDSFRFSVEKGLYKYSILPNGFEVNFTIGDIERVFYLPEAVPEYRMEELFKSMEQRNMRQIQEYYRLININNLRPADDRNELLALYPDLESNNVYVLRQDTPTFLKQIIEDIFAEIGYTAEDYENDMAFYNVVKAVTDPVFNVTLRVELDGYEMVVTIPLAEIDYKGDFPPVELLVLPFFGAGGLRDEGFMFVPDGAGAIINFNNGKSNQPAYTNRVYGWDDGIYRRNIVDDPRANFPVFGIEKNGNALICVIEEGASYASVRADVSGRGGNYNNVFVQYGLIQQEAMDIAGKSALTLLMFQKELPDETIRQRYIFCEIIGNNQRYAN